MEEYKFITDKMIIDEYRNIDFSKLGDAERLQIGFEILLKQQLAFTKNLTHPTFIAIYNQAGKPKNQSELEKKID